MNHSRPRLKAGADLQLHNAFNEGNWPVVIRLAEKRASTSKDQYYQIVKIAAECLIEDLSVKFSAVEAIWKLAQDGTVLKDVESLELLEWATRGLVPAKEFPEIFGPLRVRTVKASPKDGTISRKCLEACVLHWDLASAQQIAALMDRTFQQERRFMFWNIVITHMLSMSPQTQDKKKLYGMLAQKQVERAAQATEQADTKPVRGIQNEEEVILLYDIVATHGTAEDFERLTSSVFSPLAQLRLGRKEPLLRTIKKLSDNQNWEALFNVCQACLSLKDADGNHDFSALDWTVWRHYIAAGKNLKLTDPLVDDKVSALLTELLEATKGHKFYRRSVLLAQLHLVFALQPDQDVAGPDSRRLKYLTSYLDDQATQPTCFDDVKALLGELDSSALQYLTTYKQKDDQLSIQLLRVKLHYFAVTSPSSYTHGKKECRLCGSQTEYPCHNCCENIAVSAQTIAAAETNTNAVIEAKIVLVHLLIGPGNTLTTEVKSLVKAWALVESELLTSPGNTQLNLLSTMLSVRLGVPRHGYTRWSILDVKRAIFDSHAPLLYDRLSTIDPTIMRDMTSDDWDMLEQLSSAFDPYVNLPLPKRLLDAFGEGSYNSIMAIPEYLSGLRRSCARVMSLVEESRMERMRGTSMANLSNDARLLDVTDDTELKDVVDYGSFPSLGSQVPLHKLLAIGPGPSNTRSHLSLLAEQFHDTLTVNLPLGYKSSASSLAVDQAYILETMARLGNSFGRWLVNAHTLCTPPELIYFRTLHLLSSIISFALTVDRSSTVELTEFKAVQEALETLLEILHGAANPGSDVVQTIGSLTKLHNLAMIQYTATATKQAAQFILTVNDRAKEKDQSGQSNLHKETVAQSLVLLKAAQTALKEGKAVVAKLRGEVNAADFQRQLTAWLEDKADKSCLSQLVVGWKKTMEAWTVVKWE